MWWLGPTAGYFRNTSRGAQGLNNSPDRTGWLLLGSVWLVTLFLYILFQCVSPLLPLLIKEFHLDHWMGGFLYALPVLMIALFSYPLGVVSDRIGLKLAVGCGGAVAALSSLMRPLATNYSTLILSTAAFGLGFAMCFTNLPKLVKTNFPPRLTGTATGVYTSAIPLGTGLGIALTKPIFAVTGSWREVLLVWSLMAIPVMLLWWVVGRLVRKREKPWDQGSLYQGVPGQTESQRLTPREPEDPEPSPYDSLRKGSATQGPVTDAQNIHSRGRLVGSVLICGLLLMLLNLMFYATIGWLPTYLVEEGWDSVSAATATSVISFVEVPAVLLIPIVSDLTGGRRFILVLGFSLISLCSAGLAFHTALSWLVTPVLGTTFGGIFALLLATPVEFVRKEKVASAAGAIISIGYVGALAGPLMTGYLRDSTGSFVVGFLVLAFAGLVSAGLSYLLSTVQPQRPAASQFSLRISRQTRSRI
jgi:CP family cyanate transporter-like MFS transporter